MPNCALHPTRARKPYRVLGLRNYLNTVMQLEQ